MTAPVYVIRHGIRADDEPSPTNTYGDPSLSKEGAQQAEEVAQHLMSLIPTNQKIGVYSSPFYRCLQTANALCSKVNLPIHVDHGIGESYRTDRPEKPAPNSTEFMSKYFNLTDLTYTPSLEVNPLGESRQELRARLAPTFNHIMNHAEQEKYDVILIYTHAAVKMDLGYVLVNSPSEPAATCSMDKYTKSDGGNWVRVLNNDYSYLSTGPRNIWNFAQPDPASIGFSDVEHLVSIDTSAIQNSVDTTNLTSDELEFANLDTEAPLVRIKNKIFEGRWQKVVGTELFVNYNGEQVGTAKYRISLIPTELSTIKRQKLSDKIASMQRDSNPEQAE